MRLSYSLIEHYQTCQYRTKLSDIDRVPRVEAVTNAFRGMTAFYGADSIIVESKCRDSQTDLFLFLFQIS